MCKLMQLISLLKLLIGFFVFKYFDQIENKPITVPNQSHPVQNSNQADPSFGPLHNPSIQLHEEEGCEIP